MPGVHVFLAPWAFRAIRALVFNHVSLASCLRALRGAPVNLNTILLPSFQIHQGGVPPL